MRRFTAGFRCPVCGGHDSLRRGRGVRCYGFLSDDCRYARCTREEHAGELGLEAPTGAYLHTLDGGCHCGVEHAGCQRQAFKRPPGPSPLVTQAERTERARQVWCTAKPIRGTLAEHYLRARGITAALPLSLRFAPLLWHAPTRRELPAMVARVDNLRGEIVAVHRTYLLPDGAGRIDKMMLGPVRGGAVRLGRPARSVAITEGIETALSVVSAMPGRSVWAALSTSGLRTVELPVMPLASIVSIYADCDTPGIEAARDAAQHFARQGRSVRIAMPPGPGDFNDCLKGVG